MYVYRNSQRETRRGQRQQCRQNNYCNGHYVRRHYNRHHNNKDWNWDVYGNSNGNWDLRVEKEW